MSNIQSDPGAAPSTGLNFQFTGFNTHDGTVRNPQAALRRVKNLYEVYHFRECAALATTALIHLQGPQSPSTNGGAQADEQHHRVLAAGFHFYIGLANDSMARNMPRQALGVLPTLDEAILSYQQAVEALQPEAETPKLLQTPRIAGEAAGSGANPFVSTSSLVLPDGVPTGPPDATPARQGTADEATTPRETPSVRPGRDEASPSSVYSPAFLQDHHFQRNVPGGDLRTTLISPPPPPANSPEVESPIGSFSPSMPSAGPSSARTGFPAQVPGQAQASRLSLGPLAQDTLLPATVPVPPRFVIDPVKRAGDRVEADIVMWRRMLLAHVRSAERLRETVLSRDDAWASVEDVRGRERERR